MTHDKIDHLIQALTPHLDRQTESHRYQMPVVEYQGRKMRQGQLVFNKLAAGQVHFERWFTPVGGAGKPIKEEIRHSCDEVLSAAQKLASSPLPAPVPGALLNALRSIRLHTAS